MKKINMKHEIIRRLVINVTPMCRNSNWSKLAWQLWEQCNEKLTGLAAKIAETSAKQAMASVAGGHQA
jgi:hypothetical protein